MSNILEVKNISKQYRLGLISTGTISHDLNRWWHRMRGKEDPYLKIGETNDRTKKGDSGYVWALQDINFDVKPGEVLGIIGKNGAGKSTLLKILSRVTGPTTGTIRSRGRIASLLEVGTGFHPELTGRENIFLNGAILGMTKQEIRRKFDEIVDFAGCERYIETPVKRYSSGMYVRLAFAVAAHLEPEILVVDEVLAVGDAEFQKKAIGKMKSVSEGEGRTVLFVSHNMPSIQQLCSKVCILNNGQVSFLGDTETGVKQYLSLQKNNTSQRLSERADRKGNGNVLFQKVEIVCDGNNSDIQTGKDVAFNIYYSVNRNPKNIIFRLIVVDNNETIVSVFNNFHSSAPFNFVSNNSFVSLEIKNMPLPEGKYFYHLQALNDKQVADEIEYAGEFTVIGGDFFNTGKVPAIRKGVLIKHNWKLNEI